MSKKSKKSTKLEYYWNAERREREKAESKKKNKKDKNRNLSGEVTTKLKAVKPTLSDKEVAAVHKAADAPVKLPKEIVKAKASCNHSQNVMTPAQFRMVYENQLYLAPYLNAYTKYFGEDHVSVCSGCFTVLVDDSVVNADAVKKAFLTIDGATNFMMANKRMKSKEIEVLKKAIDDNDDLMNVVAPNIKSVVEVARQRRKEEPVKTSYGGSAPVNQNQTETSSSEALELPVGFNM